MKTLRYVSDFDINKRLNESQRVFDESSFKLAAAYALRQLSDLDTANALDQIGQKRPLHLIEAGSNIANAMCNWCEEHGYDCDAWRDFGDEEDVFFSDDPGLLDESINKDADDSTVNNMEKEEYRKMCYNASYNFVLSKMPINNIDTMNELNYAFYLGFNSKEFDTKSLGIDKDICEEAYSLGKVAAELNSYTAFIDYLTCEY